MLNKAVGFFGLALALSGCSDYWYTYHVLDSNADAGTDAAVSACLSGEPYEFVDGVYKTCCDPNDKVKSASNLQKTIELTQATPDSTSVTIKLGCSVPVQLTLQKLASTTAAGEGSMLPIIARETIIDGNGSTLDAGLNERHFLVKPNVGLTLKNIKLIRGRATAIPDATSARWPICVEGGPKLPADASCGGSILSFGRLTLDKVFITESRSENPTVAAGGAICIAGSKLTLKNSIIYGNTSVSADAGSRVEGAGIYLLSSDAEFTFSTILSNLNNTKNTGSAAAIQFTGGSQKIFTNNNSLMVNYYAFATNNNQTANYALLIPCGLTANGLSTAAFDKMLKPPTCPGSLMGYGSSLNISGTGADWPSPSMYPAVISPSGTFDGVLIKSTDPASCASAGADYFGNTRKASGCMPGAVELRW